MVEGQQEAEPPAEKIVSVAGEPIQENPPKTLENDPKILGATPEKLANLAAETFETLSASGTFRKLPKPEEAASGSLDIPPIPNKPAKKAPVLSAGADLTLATASTFSTAQLTPGQFQTFKPAEPAADQKPETAPKPAENGAPAQEGDSSIIQPKVVKTVRITAEPASAFSSFSDSTQTPSFMTFQKDPIDTAKILSPKFEPASFTQIESSGSRSGNAKDDSIWTNGTAPIPYLNYTNPAVKYELPQQARGSSNDYTAWTALSHTPVAYADNPFSTARNATDGRGAAAKYDTAIFTPTLMASMDVARKPATFDPVYFDTTKVAEQGHGPLIGGLPERGSGKVIDLAQVGDTRYGTTGGLNDKFSGLPSGVGQVDKFHGIHGDKLYDLTGSGNAARHDAGLALSELPHNAKVVNPNLQKLQDANEIPLSHLASSNQTGVPQNLASLARGTESATTGVQKSPLNIASLDQASSQLYAARPVRQENSSYTESPLLSQAAKEKAAPPPPAEASQIISKTAVLAEAKTNYSETETQIPRQIFVPSANALTDSTNGTKPVPRLAELSLARSSTEAQSAFALESAIVKTVTNTGVISEKAIVPVEKGSSNMSVGTAINGPVSLSSLRQAIESVATTASANARVIENAQTLAASQAAGIRGAIVAEQSVSALTAGKGIFADPANSAIVRSIQAENTIRTAQANQPVNPGSGPLSLTPAFQPGRIIGGSALTPGSVDPITGIPVAGRIDAASGRIIYQISGPDGVRKSDFNPADITRIQTSLGSGNRRYLTGVEIAIAVAIASAAVAKHRPQEGESAVGELKDLLEQAEYNYLSDEDYKSAASRVSGSSYKRPTYIIAHNDSLVDIAENLYHNAAVAFLIADINRGRLSEHWEDGKRIVELRSRQEIELPLPSEVQEFLLAKGKDLKAENMVTIVKMTEIDRELLDSFLSTVVGGEAKPGASPTIPSPAIAELPAELVPEGQKPLIELVNFGKALGHGLMPSMNALVKQGQNLRTYISKIDLIPREPVGGLKAEPQ